MSIIIQQDATTYSLFISVKCSACFGLYLHPSSGAHITLSTVSGINETVTATCLERDWMGTAIYIQSRSRQVAVTVSLMPVTVDTVGTAVGQWLRCCATNRKVAGSIQAGVSGFFIDIKSFRSHSASNRNEYHAYFLGVKAAGA